MEKPNSIPPAAEQVTVLLHRHFGQCLVAVYLHGSAVAGGLRPTSDIDVLAAVEQPVSPETATRLAHDLLGISKYPSPTSTVRPLEVIIFSRADLAAPAYPARCEFMYGEWLRGAFEAGDAPGPVADPELTLVLAQARREAFPLYGPGITDLLPEIPQTDVHRAIRDTLPQLLASLDEDARNVLLTLARMWRTAALGDFVPKDVAAAWAVERLPGESAAVLALTREAYLGMAEEDWRNREHAARQAANCLREWVLRSLPPLFE